MSGRQTARGASAGGDGVGLSGRSHREGIVSEGVHLLGIGESGAGIGPSARLAVATPAANGFPAGTAEGLVIVAHHLAGLDVPLPRAQDHGAGVLQHGHEERDHVTLREDVLQRAVVGRALPLPAVVFCLIVVAVALPEGDMAAAQAQGPLVAAAHEGRGTAARVLHAEGRREGLAIGLELRHGKRGERLFAGVNLSQFVAAAGASGERFHLCAEPLGVSGAPGEGGHVLREIQVYGIAADQRLVHLEVAQDAASAQPALRQGVTGFGKVFGPGLLRLKR